jgi:hypothetical protein
MTSWRVWLPLDLVLVGAFAVMGRMSHYGSLTLPGWWQTAWPFLVGAGLAWGAVLLTRRPPAAIGTGVVVWLGALVGGMVLRQASGQGTAMPFVVVATLVLAAALVGTRLVWWVRARR